MTKKQVEAWGSAQLREQLRNKTSENAKVLREAGLLDKDVIDYLIEFQHYYEPVDDSMPYRAEDTDLYQKIIKKNASKNLQSAIRNEDTNTIHHFLGVQELDVTMEGNRTYEKISRWIARETAINYLAGYMGTGKTDFAILMAEIWSYRKATKNRRLEIATNVKSLSIPEPIKEKFNIRLKYINNQPELVEWLESENEEDGKDVIKRFMFDEASSHASGYSKDSSKVTNQFSSMVKLVRKNNGNMDIIGHTGKDVHPDIRRLADYVEKKGKKNSAVFENVKEGEGEDKKFDISKIPKTTWSYDTKEESTWEWATDEGEEGKSLLQIACEVYIESDMTQREVADLFDAEGVSKAGISQNYMKYED